MLLPASFGGRVSGGRLERPLRRRDAAVLDEALHLVTEVGCDDVHLGARRDQRLDLAGRNPSAAHDHAAPSGDEQVDRVPAERSAACHTGAPWLAIRVAGASPPCCP